MAFIHRNQNDHIAAGRLIPSPSPRCSQFHSGYAMLSLGGQERMNRAGCESRGIFSCLVINPRYRARAKPIGTVVLVNHQGSRRKGNLYCPGSSASTHWVK